MSINASVRHERQALRRQVDSRGVANHASIQLVPTVEKYVSLPRADFLSRTSRLAAFFAWTSPERGSAWRGAARGCPPVSARRAD